MGHTLLPEGLRDRLPPFADAAQAILRSVGDTIARHGYSRVEPPLAEYEATLTAHLRHAGARDLFRMVDPVSARTLAIRPDMTAQVSRIATTRLAEAPRPLRLAYSGTVLKLRATQLRPERETVQIGAELIGSDTTLATVEIINIAVEALLALGVEDITLDLTLPNLVDALADGPWPLQPATRDAVRAALDSKDAGRLIALGAAAYLPLLTAAGPLDAAMAQLRALAVADVLARWLDLVAAIGAAVDPRVRVTLDPTERHGFEYQTGLGFGLFAAGLGGEIGRGGAYSVNHDDGRDEPAVGFSLYLDPLVDAGFGQSASKRVFLPMLTPADIAAGLRADGWVTLAALSAADTAESLGCSHHLVNGAPQPIAG